MKKIVNTIIVLAMLAAILVVPANAAGTKEYMTSSDLVAVLSAKTGITGSNVDETLTNLKAAGIINLVQYNCIKENKLPRSMVWAVLLPGYGIYPYPTELVAPDMPVIKGCEGVYHNARVAVLQMGLATEQQVSQPTYRLTKSEFNALVGKLNSGDYTDQSVYLPAASILCPYLEGVERNAETYKGINALLVSYPGMVQTLGKYLDAFQAEGWTIRIGAYADLDKNPENGAEYAVPGGVCSYTAKEIWLNNATSKTPYHELGHYIARLTGLRSYLPSLFEEEGKAVQPIIGDYSQTNPNEFWADVFGYYFSNPALRPALKEAAPKTVQVLEDGLLAVGEGKLIDLDVVASIVNG